METQAIRLLAGDCRAILPTLEPESVQCCVTSPPYWGLRDYGVNGQLSLEATPEEYIANMVAVFREVWRVLKPDATCWVNLGDSYGQNQGKGFDTHNDGGLRKAAAATSKVKTGLKPKDLCGIPWRLAFALQADGWYLRSDIIWAKPNPMPESVTDRPTKAHEYIFLLTKQERYFYDAEAIRERGSDFSIGRLDRHYTNPKQSNGDFGVKPGEISGSEIREFRNKRTVWTIPTQPFSDWTETFRLERVSACAACDGSLRIGSPDCLEHGDCPDQVPKAFCDEHVIGELSRMLDMPIDRVQALVTSPEAFGLHRARCSLRGSWDWPRLQCSASAKVHSNESRKMDLVPATNLSCMPSAQKFGRIDDTPALFDLGDLVGRKPGNRIAADFSRDEPMINIAETECHICGKCRCAYVSITYHEVSHFATFPEEIPKLCILAGSKPGNTILDPFAGSGTVGKVALELGRRAILIELNPAYLELARDRTYVTPGFF